MATNKNFVVKNGLEVGGQEVINSSGVVTSAALGGQTLGTTDNPTFANLTLTGYLAGPSTFTIDPAGVGDNTGTLVIAGNLQVDGTTTTINSTTMEVDDLNITLASGAANAAAANGAGLTIDGANVSLTYQSTGNNFYFSEALKVAGTRAETSLVLLSGDTSVAAFGGKQIVMGYNGTQEYQHSIRTRHSSSTSEGNAIDFYVWDYGTDATNTVGTQRIASIEGDIGINVEEGGYQVGGTTVIDASRNLTNIGDIEVGNNEIRILRGNTRTRKIVLYDAGVSNDYEFYGLGVESASFITSIYSTSDTFHWYAGVNSTTRSLAGSLSGTGVFNAVDSYQINGTTVIDSSRNLTNTNIYLLRDQTGSMYVSPTYANTLNGNWHEASDSGDLWINYLGYQGGTTYYRDFRIGDGKNNYLLWVDASAARFSFGTNGRTTNLDIDGKLVIGSTTLGSERLRIVGTNTTGTGVYMYADITNEIDSNFRINISGSGRTDKVASIGPSTNTALVFNTGDTERARFRSDGNFGISTSDPTYKLVVSEAGAVISSQIPVNGTTMKGIQLYNQTTATDNNAVGLWMATGPHQAGIASFRADTTTWETTLAFYTHEEAVGGLTTTTERMRITKDGYVKKHAQPSFTASSTSNIVTVPSGDNNTISSNFNKNSATGGGNVGSHYNTSTGIFTAPIDGRYLFTFSLRWETGDFTQSSYIRSYISVNNAQDYETGHQINGNNEAWSNYMAMSSAVIVHLSEGDTVRLKGGMNGGTSQLYAGESNWSGMYLG
jgi:hypothetical protein